MLAPLSHRLLLQAYPRWFRDEFAHELTGHLAYQRTELRYRRRAIGAVRFWWDAGTDAVVTGATLRLGRASDRWSSRWQRMWSGLRASGAGGLTGGGAHGPRTGGVGTMLETIMRDVRHAMRGLTKNPGYALVFVVTLGLGIGANTAMFSAVNGVLLRPLPHDDGDRLVYLRQSATLAGIPNTLFSVPEIDDYRQRAPSLEAVAEFSALTFTMLGYETPRRVRAGIVTGNYFGVMGLSSRLGRTVGPEDDGQDAPAVIVLSDAYWRNVFGADPDILGKTVEINGRTATFVGVAEPAPPYPERTDIYVNMATSPHHLDASMSHDRIHRMTEVCRSTSGLVGRAGGRGFAGCCRRRSGECRRSCPDALHLGAVGRSACAGSRDVRRGWPAAGGRGDRRGVGARVAGSRGEPDGSFGVGVAL